MTSLRIKNYYNNIWDVVNLTLKNKSSLYFVTNKNESDLFNFKSTSCIKIKQPTSYVKISLIYYFG